MAYLVYLLKVNVAHRKRDTTIKCCLWKQASKNATNEKKI